MKLICVSILLFFIPTMVFGRSGAVPTTKAEAFSVFSFINNFSNGVTNLASVFTNVKDILNAFMTNDSSYILKEDKDLNIMELTRKYGYLLEEHEVITEDGYILTIHRIPYGGKGTMNRKVIFLMHGLLDSSDSWILQGPQYALAYILADHGFDVWMGNARGNKHSLSHITLSANDTLYWEFTWEEIGLYDLPSMIDYTLNVTGVKDLYYVGHSQGTTVFYVMNSMRPAYNKKIKLMFSLSPVAWLSHAKSPLVKMFSPAAKFLGFLLSIFNTISPSPKSINNILSYICSMYVERCKNSLFTLTGDDSLINSTMLPVILGHVPSGASIHQFVHYGQLVESGRFCRFDFGEDKNMELYDFLYPPDYNLVHVTAPVCLFYSDKDWLSNTSDVSILKDNLANVYGFHLVPNFSHVDFMYSFQAKEKIYLRILDIIQSFKSLENTTET